MYDTPTTLDNIRIRVYDAADVPTAEAAERADPQREYRTHNTTRVAYHKEIIDGLVGSTTPDIEADKLVLGDSTADTDTLAETAVLGNETFRTSITDTVDNGQTFQASIFIDSTEGVGQTFEEAALVAETGSGDLPINRFLIDDPGGLLDPKSGDETVTIDIDITQEDGG